LQAGDGADLSVLPDDTQICNCNAVCKGTILEAIRGGKTSVATIGDATRAGTGCGTCQPLLSQLLAACGKGPPRGKEKNKVEAIKDQKDSLDGLPDILKLAATNNWQEMTEADKQRAKWYGLFFRTPTPGHFMLRLRFEAGRTRASAT
jgi:nitrite reductase (NADH) large subunit